MPAVRGPLGASRFREVFLFSFTSDILLPYTHSKIKFTFMLSFLSVVLHTHTCAYSYTHSHQSLMQSFMTRIWIPKSDIESNL